MSSFLINASNYRSKMSALQRCKTCASKPMETLHCPMLVLEEIVKVAHLMLNYNWLEPHINYEFPKEAPLLKNLVSHIYGVSCMKCKMGGV